MRFKSITCLTKVTKNQTQTQRNENTILFNDSKIEIVNDKLVRVHIEGREVFFIASSNSIREKEGGRTYYNVTVNWVKCIENGEVELKLPEGVTDILVVTQEIFNSLREQGYEAEDIYSLFREKGLGKMSTELSNVEDFSVLTAQIIE